MMKFFLKCFFLVIVLLFGVLYGMQQANDGMQAMRGEEDSLPAVIGWSADEEELEVLGKELTSHDLKEKQEKLEDIGTFNFFSGIGHSIAEFLSQVAKATVALVTSMIDKLIETLF